MQKQSDKFSKEKRLHYHWEYRRFYGKSQIFRLSACTVYRIPNNLKYFRLGITIKARGSSVERNKVKRQIREIFRNLSSILGNFDYNVVIPASRKMEYPYHTQLAVCLRRELKDAVSKTE
ncbi:MAG: ribonuclease P protein component [Bdellovibrionales bacterium RIFOXYD1_FULL_44_7]|nr:MAG: ribonuclease P protein component [Bdellovibrionales bacterium RIFOXYD1_FULL_44_7]